MNAYPTNTKSYLSLFFWCVKEECKSIAIILCDVRYLRVGEESLGLCKSVHNALRTGDNVFHRVPVDYSVPMRHCLRYCFRLTIRLLNWWDYGFYFWNRDLKECDGSSIEKRTDLFLNLRGVYIETNPWLSSPLEWIDSASECNPISTVFLMLTVFFDFPDTFAPLASLIAFLSSFTFSFFSQSPLNSTTSCEDTQSAFERTFLLLTLCESVVALFFLRKLSNSCCKTTTCAAFSTALVDNFSIISFRLPDRVGFLIRAMVRRVSATMLFPCRGVLGTHSSIFSATAAALISEDWTWRLGFRGLIPVASKVLEMFFFVKVSFLACRRNLKQVSDCLWYCGENNTYG